MRVTVQFYARLRDLAGCSEWTADVPAGVTVGDVWRASVEAYPALAIMSTSVSCAVNAEFARMDTTIRDCDEVAYLPPVSGGAR